MWFATQWGIGVGPDSVDDLESAEKLLAAAAVMFTRFAWRDYLRRPATLEQDYGLEAACRAPGGVVYSQRGRPLRRSPTRD